MNSSLASAASVCQPIRSVRRPAAGSLNTAVFWVCVFCREKKKEKEREELWKKLEDLELKRGLRSEGSSQLNKNNAMYP